MFDSGQQTLIEIYMSKTIKSIERPINIKFLTNTHQSLYTAIVIGNAFHVCGILPVGNALLIEGAATEDKTCLLLHNTNAGICHQTVLLINHVQSSGLLWSERTNGVGRTAYSCCVPGWSHLPHNIGEVVLCTDLIRRCAKNRKQISFTERNFFLCELNCEILWI